MNKKLYHIAITSCAILFCVASVLIGYNNNTGDNKIDNNFWADNSNSTSPPFTVYTPTASPDANIKNITYSSAAQIINPNHTGYWTPYSQTQGCNILYNQSIIRPKGNKTLSITEDTGYALCQHLVITAENLRKASNFQAEYDTIRAYMEHCAYLSNSWHSFIDVGQADADRSNDIHRFEEFREWLKKVLYYNLDTTYYCADVNEILHTFSWFNDQRGKDWRGNIAVLKFLVSSNKCPKVTAYYDTAAIPATWNELYSVWLDSVKNPTLTPFDSTLPTLDDLDLGILRGKPADVNKYFDTKLGPIMSDIRALENPFTSETKIAFTTREAVAIKMEIFDVLGKRYYSTEKVFDQGENQLIVQGKDFPHEILYARFSASDGTVVTVKLRHE